MSTMAPGLLSVFERNQKRLERIKFLGQIFETNGFELRIAGGAVRDILGGVEPQDIDFATTALPEESLKILSKHEDSLRIIVTAAGQKHGTVAVKFKEGELDFKKIKLESNSNDQNVSQAKGEPVYDDENPFEITTLRCDRFTDGRHAEVEFVNDWRVDAERRDLTINAMFLTLDDGSLVDYFDGQADLKNGVVRFVGSADSRIKEDYLRILRFFRFWSRYGRNKQPDNETLLTIRNNLDGFKIISGERIWLELKKIFARSPCSEVIKLMLKLNLFDHIGMTDKEFPSSYDDYIRNVSKDIESIESNIEKYLSNVKVSLDKKFTELLPVVLMSTIIRSEEMLINAHTRMKFSNLERDTIMYIIEQRSRDDITIKSLKQQLATMHVPDRPQALNRFRGALICKGLIDLILELDSWPIPSFPITGTVVSDEFKKRKLKGNKIKDVLTELKNHWAENDYKLNEEQLKEVLRDKCDKLSNTIK